MNRITKIIISAISACILLLFLAAALNRSGSLLLFWEEKSLGKITHDERYGYYAYIPNENVSRLNLPVYLKEDERFPDRQLLSVNEDITASIKTQGGGRYTVQANNDIYFSASDNRPEEHDYSIVAPIIIQNRYLLVLFCFAITAGALNLYLCRKHKDFEILNRALRWTGTVCFLMLLLPWNKLIFPAPPTPFRELYFKPILQRNIFQLGLILAFLLFIFRRTEKKKPFLVLSAILVMCSTVYYFAPEWNRFGRRNDSQSYLEAYQASSIRTPGYPMFIESIYKLSGNRGLDKIRAGEYPFQNESLLDNRETESMGLINIVKTQKIILGIVFLALFIVFCQYYTPLWFVFFAQIVLCGGFLGVDNSYVMSECLSQAATLAAAAAIIRSLKERKTVPFLMLCILSAAAILIRPANIFLALPVLICGFVFIQERKKVLTPAAGILLFLGLISIPAINIYKHYNIFVWMPTSGYAEIGRAIELMQPGDEEAFNDTELRNFCEEVLEKKQLYDNEEQNTFVWQIALPAAEARGYDKISCSTLFGKVSREIFSIHYKELIVTLTETIKTAFERTRLQFSRLTFLSFALLFTLLFIFRINTDSLTGMLFMLLHLIHLGISMVNQPERRYIYSTEILCLLGWLLILYNFINYFIYQKKSFYRDKENL